MLNGVGVAWHAAAGLHDKAAHGKMRALFGADKHLALGIFAASYSFKRQLIGLAHGHGIAPS